MKKYLKILIVTIVMIASGQSVFAQENVGIVQGLWFSEKVFYAGDTIRMYAAVQNNTGYDVEGVIEFFDNDVSLGEKNFATLDDRIIESWIDFTVTEGDHDFTVKIKRLNKNGGSGQSLPVVGQVLATQGVLAVEADTDGDDIPNSEDSDDDGDGISDTEELEQGTDPLEPESQPVVSGTVGDDGEVDAESAQSESFQDFLDKIGGLLNRSGPQSESSNGDTYNTTNTTNNNTVNNLGGEEKAVQKEEEKAELINQFPDQVKKITEQQPVLEPVALTVSRIQKKAQDFVEKKSRSYKKPEIDIVEDNIEGSIKKAAQYKAKKGAWEQVQNVFDIWWVFLVLIFVSIWIVLKILFKIFGRIVRSRAE